MRIHYDVKPGIVLDFNDQKEVVGIEVLDLKRRSKLMMRIDDYYRLDAKAA
jgi:Protein of unknown function (DUF2283)